MMLPFCCDDGDSDGAAGRRWCCGGQMWRRHLLLLILLLPMMMMHWCCLLGWWTQHRARDAVMQEHYAPNDSLFGSSGAGTQRVNGDYRPTPRSVCDAYTVYKKVGDDRIRIRCNWQYPFIIRDGFKMQCTNQTPTWWILDEKCRYIGDEGRSIYFNWNFNFRRNLGSSPPADSWLVGGRGRDPAPRVELL